MIKIVKGIYGYRNQEGVIEPKNTASSPFSLTEEKEAELVRKGIAVYVDEFPYTESDEDGGEDASPGENSEDISPGENGEYVQENTDIWNMDYNELQRYAKELGISAKGTKAELTERISEKLNIPPNLTAAVPQ